MKASSPLVLFKSNKESGRDSLTQSKLLATTWSKNSMPTLGNQKKKRGSHTPTQQWLDHVQEDLCIEGGEWVHHKDGRPHYLRRADLEPMTKGWYDFICRSIMPTTNRSELTVGRAVLIHSIIIGENINVEEIIAKQFYKFIYKTDLSFEPKANKTRGSSSITTATATTTTRPTTRVPLQLLHSL
ncbi:hypothetical protein PIB30_084642 [Stylosanthes scabra]|uniref:Putative plant transposon protein domain-containing protein n=1 Tax=Stylosanthes scabra TaxID=79078 RepID=A0ABU6VR41_9FABA|nr:hypothetical protein [Stylosanthes scabra]